MRERILDLFDADAADHTGDQVRGGVEPGIRDEVGEGGLGVEVRLERDGIEAGEPLDDIIEFGPGATPFLHLVYMERVQRSDRELRSRARPAVARNTASIGLWHFPIMIAVSLVLYVGVLRLVMGRRGFRDRLRAVIIVSLVVVVGGMLIGKYGASLLGLPWWIYYPLPAILTLVLAPLVFRFPVRRTLLYLVFAAASAPVIHLGFSFFLGWGEYMPFGGSRASSRSSINEWNRRRR